MHHTHPDATDTEKLDYINLLSNRVQKSRQKKEPFGSFLN
jgi:hypothetical protein